MARNFFRRVETCYPIENSELADRIACHSLNNYLQDNSQAWLLQSDGSYKPLVCNGEKEAPRSAQETLLRDLAN